MTRFLGPGLATWLVVVVIVSSSVVFFTAAPHPAASTPAPRFTVSPTRASPGLALVAGRDSPMPFAQQYAVSFTESGLPSGLTWTVTVGRASSSYLTDGGTDGLAFVEPNGTYSYSITDISGWHQGALPYHGNITVSGSAVTEPTLLYTPVTYPVTFGESGLPSGRTFAVTVASASENLTTDGGNDSLVFAEPNGSFSYAIADVPGWHQTSLPYHGSVIVSGAAVTPPVAVFTPVTYSVTFSESGIPSGHTWQIAVNGSAESLTTNGATDLLTWTGLANGTYPYVISDVAGWHQSRLPYSGSVVVNGASVAEPNLVYLPVSYGVTFVETGLPNGTTLQITVGPAVQTLTANGGTDSLFFNLGNGTYAYAITDVAGWHQATIPYHGSITVAGAPVTEPTLDYVQVTYSVVFQETGLPPGTNWSVTLGLTTVRGNGSSLTFSVPNGTFAVTIGLVAGWHVAAPHGSLTVAGGPLTESYAFVATTYSVTFAETTLPALTSWSVTLNGSTMSTTGSTISFSERNGSYAYRINYVSGYTPTLPSGTVNVAGAPVSVAVTFVPVHYVVTFAETGLKAGKPWMVDFDGARQQSVNSSISFLAGNGTHTYLIAGPAHWRVSSVLPPEGTISVAGASVNQSVIFVKGGTGAMHFREKGLGVGTTWCVLLGAELCSSTNLVVQKNLTPGTYSYSIQSFGGMTTVVKYSGVYVAAAGSIGLAHGATFKIRYTWPVTFTETGLPLGTAWTVSGGHTKAESTTNHAVLYLINGTYTFHVHLVTGYKATPGSGGIVVAGTALAVTVKFAPKPVR